MKLLDIFLVFLRSVTPFMGVWIEIDVNGIKINIISVTPFMGVWIEITTFSATEVADAVTPFMGVWIEITKITNGSRNLWSLPSWECGLKSTKYCGLPTG